MDWHQIDGQLDPRSLIDVVEQIQGYSLPSRILEHEAHSSTNVKRRRRWSRCTVRIGSGCLDRRRCAGKDIRIKLYLRAHVSLLHQANPALGQHEC